MRFRNLEHRSADGSPRGDADPDPARLLSTAEGIPASPHSRLKSSTTEIAEAMFEIYNLCGKVAQHRRSSPWSLIASHLDLLPYVTPPSRDDLPFSAKDIRSGNDAKVMLASFLHSRVLTHQPSDRAKPSS